MVDIMLEGFNPDFKQLREQKITLLRVCDIYPELDGIVSLLDYIQDQCVRSGIFTEEEVFNMRNEPSLFEINGIWKYTKEIFEGYLVYAYDNEPPKEYTKATDDDIFYYGLGLSDIQGAIEDYKLGQENVLPFDITSYKIID